MITLKSSKRGKSNRAKKPHSNSEDKHQDLANSLERKKAEEDTKMAANIFDLATDSIFVHDTGGKIINFNETACKKLGYSKEEMSKMKISDLDVPDFAVQMESRLKHLLETGDSVFESVHMRKDGTLLNVEVHARIVDLEGKRLVVSVVRDVTERKRAEEALSQAMDKLVLVNEKLDVMGRLTRHDIRNKLAGMGGCIHVLKKTHSDIPDIMARLNTIEQGCKSIVEILDFTKIYEELGSKELCFVDVGKTMDEAVALFSGPLNLKIVNECHDLNVLADSFLKQLFYTMLDNSEKHGEHATKIIIRYEKTDHDKLVLIYEDDGIGVSADNKSKLFKEGFSTSGSTGYGLCLVKKTMDVYGWSIQENGEPGKGARFTITIPYHNKKGKENFQIK